MKLHCVLAASAFSAEPTKTPPGLTSSNAPVKPLKNFILAGQSNMQGQRIVTAQDMNGSEKPGTLVSMLHNPAKAALLKHWVDAKGAWAERPACAGGSRGPRDPAR